MTTLTGANIRMAMQSLRTTKLRSALTMFGIIIGVMAVIMAVSLGEGIRRQVSVGLATGKNDVVSVRPGKLVTRDQSGTITGVDYLGALGNDSLTNQDAETISKLPETEHTVPLATFSGRAVSTDGTVYKKTVLIATTPDFPEVFNAKITYGGFFTSSENQQNSVVIGKNVAEQLFKENVPIGREVTIRDKKFVVVGVFDHIESNILTTVHELDDAIFMSYGTANELSSQHLTIYSILASSKSSSTPAALAADITPKLTANHGDQADFTILQPSDTLHIASSAVNIATAFIAGIAAISLIVGGIGIMNIMFVSVTERTREIGVRKSIGATNQQIYGQFLIEATALSIVGGIIGVGLALAGNFVVRVTTSLHPVATLPIILLAVGASTAVGIIFGTAPAVKAARKDPIESLRYQ
jgi:putative ABC transport system permease protein